MIKNTAFFLLPASIAKKALFMAYPALSTRGTIQTSQSREDSTVV